METTKTETVTPVAICNRVQSLANAKAIATRIDAFTLRDSISRHLIGAGVKRAKAGKTVQEGREYLTAWRDDFAAELLGHVQHDACGNPSKPWSESYCGDKVTHLLTSLQMPLNTKRGTAGNSKPRHRYAVKEGTAFVEIKGTTVLCYNITEELIGTVSR